MWMLFWWSCFWRNDPVHRGIYLSLWSHSPSFVQRYVSLNFWKFRSFPALYCTNNWNIVSPDTFLDYEASCHGKDNAILYPDADQKSLKEEIGSFLDRSLPVFLNPSISQFSLFKDGSVVKALAENTIGSGLHPISSFTFFWNEENR